MRGNPIIAVVDDEPDIREMVVEYLERNGFDCLQAGNAEAFRRLMDRDKKIDLALLDINMPGEDGLTLARSLKETSSVAIVFMTAAGDPIDRIVGLELGGDDYLVKPVDLREMLARIRAVLRRTKDRYLHVSPMNTRVAMGSCILDVEAHKLFDADGGEVKITNMEFDLLKAFVDHPNRVLSRDFLLDVAHNRDWDPYDRSVDIRIARIRKKLESDPEAPEVIKTVRGAGYIFVPPQT